MKKNIGKRILSLALALVMVAGMMPRMATEAHAAGPITLEGETFTTSPGEGFAIKAFFFCYGCDKYVYIDSDIENHSFEITSFTYEIANGVAKWNLTANYQGCLGSGTGTNSKTCNYICTEKLYNYYGVAFDSDSNNQKYAGLIAVDIRREKTAHKGDATCKTADTCALCANSFTNANNHEKPDEFTYSVNTSDSTKHDVKFACCGATKETVAHTAEPTYTVNAADHTKHDKTYSCCEGIAETTGHSYTYTADGFVLTEKCTNGCGHQAIASIVAGEALYTGSEITDAATISYDSGTWGGDEPVLSFENNVTVGTATAKMTAGDATASTTFKINPASLSYATVTLDPASGIYNGEFHSKPSYKLTYNEKELKEGTDYYVDGNWTGDFTNAGSYDLLLKGNGNFTGYKTLTYTIHKATPTFTAPAAKELTYNGQPLALVEAGSVNPGKLMYSLDGEDYSETVPTATNAGNYTVYYKVEGLNTDNYNEIPSGSVSVTIRKAEAPDITFPEVLNAITYGQKLEEAKLSFYENDYGTFNWNAPTAYPGNAGTGNYALDFYPNELALQNYDWKDAGEAQWIANRNALCICPNVTVNKAAAAITTVPTPNDLIYNGEDQPLVTAGSVTGGTMVYSLEKEGTYTADLPKAMDVDTYTVWYKVDADSNHTTSAAPASVTVKIKKANSSVDAPAAISGLVYNGREQYLITSAVSMDGTVYYSLDGDNYTESLPKGTNAQEYTVYYKVVGDVNHNDMEPKTVTAKIAPWNIETTSCKAGVWGGPFTYNGQEHTPTPQIDAWVDDYPVPESPYAPGADVRLTEGTDYTVTYSNNVNAGQAVVTFTGKGNYTGTITREFTIAPKALDGSAVSIPDMSLPYTGEAQTVAIVVPEGVTYELVEGTMTATNAGMYGFTIQFTGNHTGISTQGWQITAVAPNATAPTANTLTYNGEDQTLIAAGATNDGTMVYSLEKEGEYKAELPKAKTAGTYHVWYKVIGDGNHTDSAPASVEVKIDKADPGIGIVTAGVVNDTLETSAIVLTRADTTVPGTLTVDAEQILAWGDNTIRYTFTPNDTTNYKVIKGEVAVTVVDTIAPVGTVSIDDNKWSDLWNTITFGLFFKETKTVKVAAEDVLSGIAKVEYYDSATALSADAVKAITAWNDMGTDYAQIVTAEDAKTFIYYIRITDKAGNVTYISTADATYDLTKPAISGITNGSTYYTTQKVTVTDKNIDTITLNGEAVTDAITLEGNKEATYTIVATDKAGNSTTVTVTMKPIKELAKATENLGNDNVTSADAPALEELVAKLDELIADPDTSDDGEKETLEQHKTIAESLLETIEAAAEATDTENVGKVENVTPENVIPENKTDLEGAKADLEKALEDNGGNYTEDEKKAIEDEIKRIDDALEVIGNVEAVEETISKLPAVDTVKPDDEEAIKAITDAQTAYNALSDYEKSLVDEAAKANLDKLVAALVAYDIVEGDGSSWTEDSDHNITFVVNGLFSKFVGIKVDGKDVDKANYEVKAGSTIIILKASYLDILAVGEHTISVVYTDGSTDGAFNVHAKANSPATGDDFNIALYSSLMTVSVTALVVLLLASKKRKQVK